MPDDKIYTTIKVSKELRDRIKELGKMSETFGMALTKIILFYEENHTQK